jgi:hypothetical protein
MYGEKTLAPEKLKFIMWDVIGNHFSFNESSPYRNLSSVQLS